MLCVTISHHTIVLSLTADARDVSGTTPCCCVSGHRGMQQRTAWHFPVSVFRVCHMHGLLPIACARLGYYCCIQRNHCTRCWIRSQAQTSLSTECFRRSFPMPSQPAFLHQLAPRTVFRFAAPALAALAAICQQTLPGMPHHPLRHDSLRFQASVS